MSTQHISTVESKTALNLARAKLHDDRYHNAIAEAAREMVSRGHAGWLYTTQYASGTTVWRSKGHTISIEREVACL